MAELAKINLILFFNPGVSLKLWDNTGILEREVALYRSLLPRLSSVTFVTFGDGSDLAYAGKLDGIRIVCNTWKLPQHWYTRFVYGFYALPGRGVTVLKSNQVKGGIIALKAARFFGKKFIARCGYLHSEFMEYEYGMDSREAQQARALEQNIFSSADKIVVTTPSMRQSVIQRYQVPFDRVRVIPNYVDTHLFSPSAENPQMPRRICFIGRLTEQKNLFSLFHAVRDLDIELVMVGSGPLASRLREEAHTLNMRVQFLGNVPHRRLPGILRSSNLFILPSLYEGHPKALLEAMACGLPVIGTEVPGIREIICHRQTGFLCGTSSAEIRSAIGEVLSDAELRARMGQSARTFVVDNFSLDRIVDMELKLLKELIKE